MFVIGIQSQNIERQLDVRGGPPPPNIGRMSTVREAPSRNTIFVRN
uniref:Uncharacterized protein n=1 Tax=Cyanoptyche gloeocystis TaxID=77922 RepID=A0A3G1IW92_9EUKA|nr:hypothetical protein [Cyanoptyche gloeocystis]ASQ40327.1 hypothetical protein [Cyanoptyche gloeocystis]